MTDRLLADQSLVTDQELHSPNGRHRLVMQGDGNLVLYRANGKPKWATGTDGRQIGAAYMQGDGNLVLYDAAGAVWASGTHGNPGAHLVLQDDGNLVIYHPQGHPLWATGTNVTMVRVTGFTPSTRGFAFPNSFPHAPDIQINVLGQNVAIGDAANGLCGGMVFAARDFFEAGQPRPAVSGPQGPTSGPLFDFIVRRLFDSFELPGGPLRYMHLMSPALPDHETWASQAGVAPHGRAWVAIREEWPKIRAGIDANRPMPMALVLVKTFDPFELGHNHQVLAWGYDLDGEDLSILVYDPNHLNNDNVRIDLDISNPLATTTITQTPGPTRPGSQQVHCFFTPAYAFAMPPADMETVPPQAKLTVTNRTPSEQIVRMYNPGDMVMLAPLPAGEFSLGPGKRAEWVFHNGMPSVRITANGRFVGSFLPGAEVVLGSDTSVAVRNATSAPVRARFFHENDGLMWVTLPGGDLDVPAFEQVHYNVPPNLSRVKVVVGGQTFRLGLGETALFAG